MIPGALGEIILQILRLETVAVLGEDGIAHDAEGGFLQFTELAVIEQESAGEVETGEIVPGPFQRLLASLAVEHPVFVGCHLVKRDAVECHDGLPLSFEAVVARDADDTCDMVVEEQVIQGSLFATHRQRPPINDDRLAVGCSIAALQLSAPLALRLLCCTDNGLPVKHILQQAFLVIEAEQFVAVFIDETRPGRIAEGIETFSIGFLTQHILIFLAWAGREPERQFLTFRHRSERYRLVGMDLGRIAEASDTPFRTVGDAWIAGDEMALSRLDRVNLPVLSHFDEREQDGILIHIFVEMRMTKHFIGIRRDLLDQDFLEIT